MRTTCLGSVASRRRTVVIWKSLSLCIAAGFGLCLLGNAIAAGETICVNFVGGSALGDSGYLGGGPVSVMQANEVAGVVPQAFWNNAGIGGQSNDSTNNTGTLPGGSVVDSVGATVDGLSVVWNAPNTFSTMVPDTSGNDRLMKGYLDTRNLSNPYQSSAALVTIDNLPNDLTQSGYDVFVYFDGLMTVGVQDRIGRYRVYSGTDTTGPLLGETFGRDPAGVDFSGTIALAGGTSAASATAGNYVEFSNLQAATFTIEAFGVAGDVARAPINAIQIVPAGLVPEPSVLVMLGAGAMSLVGYGSWRRRQRRS